MDECLQGLHNCKSEQECENTPGGYKCINTCPTGLERAGNGTCIGRWMRGTFISTVPSSKCRCVMFRWWPLCLGGNAGMPIDFGGIARLSLLSQSCRS